MEPETSKFLGLDGLPALWEETRKLAGGSGVKSPDLDAIRVMDRAEYLALGAKDPRTLYLLRG